jgi:preprotein translocase subunit SecE
MKKITEFIKNIIRELKKVTWISKKEVIRLTLIVLSISLVIGLFLQSTDLFLQYIIKKYL